jgi:hypothetical protein
VTLTLDTHHLPAVACEPRCTDGTGHTAETHPVDQACFSEQHEVNLTRQPMLLYAVGETQQSCLDYLSAHLGREREGRPYVSLTHADSPVVEMTPAEALQLAEALTALASGRRRHDHGDGRPHPGTTRRPALP